MKFSKFILIILIIILIHILIKVFLEMTSEDNYLYQKYIDTHNKLPIIKIKFKKKKDFNNFKKSISKNMICDQFNQKNSHLKIDLILSENDISNNQSKYLQLKFISKFKTIQIIYNPFYINNSDLLNLFNLIINQKWLNFNQLSLKSISINDFYKFLRYLNSFFKSESFDPLIRSTQNLNLFKTHTIEKNDISNRYSENYIIYLIIRQIYKCLNISRPVRIFMPTFYERLNKINNNIGGIFILYFKNDTFDTFNNRLESSRYMDQLTNFFIYTKINKFILNSQKLRQKIDIIIEFYSLNLNYNLKLNFKYQNILDEPIHINIFNKILSKKYISDISYVISTSNFKKEIFLAEQDLGSLEK